MWRTHSPNASSRLRSFEARLPEGCNQITRLEYDITIRKNCALKLTPWCQEGFYYRCLGRSQQTCCGAGAPP